MVHRAGLAVGRGAVWYYVIELGRVPESHQGGAHKVHQASANSDLAVWGGLNIGKMVPSCTGRPSTQGKW